MKTIRTLIATATISAALFASCNKENSLETTAVTAIKGDANITYQLQVLLPPSSNVKWSTGSISTSDVVMNASYYEGNSITKNSYAAKDPGTYNLFAQPILGTVTVPYNSYLGLSAAIQLNQYNSVSALSLQGTFAANPGANPIPIQVTIDQPAILMSSVWLSNTSIDQPSYLATLSIDMSQITDSITTSMFENAQISNGSIIISNSSNVNLYNIIVSNLQNVPINIQLAVQPTNSTSTSSASQPENINTVAAAKAQ